MGGVCFLTNLAVLYVGTGILEWHYLASMALSIAVANTLGWVLNRVWTFSSTASDWLREYFRYLTVNLSGFALSLGLMALLVSGLGINYLIASAAIAVALTVINFALHRGWSFAVDRHPDSRS